MDNYLRTQNGYPSFVCRQLLAPGFGWRTPRSWCAGDTAKTSLSCSSAKRRISEHSPEQAPERHRSTAHQFYTVIALLKSETGEARTQNSKESLNRTPTIFEMRQIRSQLKSLKLRETNKLQRTNNLLSNDLSTTPLPNISSHHLKSNFQISNALHFLAMTLYEKLVP